MPGTFTAQIETRRLEGFFNIRNRLGFGIAPLKI